MPARIRRWLPATAAATFLIAALGTQVPGAASPKPAAGQAPAQPQQAAETQQAEAAQPAPAPVAAEYIGSEMCQACHEDVFNAFQKTPHRLIETSRKHRYEGRSCESCHGPGSRHAESGSAEDLFNPAKAPVSEADNSCLKCHLNQKTHIGRVNGGHANGQVACTSCHSIHRQGPDALTPRKPSAVNQQCASCHISEWAQFTRPHSHRLREGAMSCVDCHNPHGNIQPQRMQLVSANEPGCFKCHGDKRGPFVFEHAPMKVEGCMTCHEPHGSANPRRLIRHEVRFVCMECHSNLASPQPVNNNAVLGGIPPGFHNLLSPRIRNCTICHIKVHGSNVNRALLR